jgi:hypothetical protein
LALEAGRITQAKAHFSRARDFWNSQTGRFFDNPESLYVRRIAEQSLKMLARVNPHQ